MLQTQVNYWANVETKRHNLETERQGLLNVNEAVRHNKRTEALSQFHEFEISRHNLRTEGFTSDELIRKDRERVEQARHNVQQEAIGFQNAQASLMQARAAQEQARAATRNAASNAIQAAAATRNAATSAFSALQQSAVQRAQASSYRASARKTKTETKYIGQKNAQGWVSAISQAGTAISKFIPFSKSKGGR
nr:putative ORF1 [Marmot picobirnavirus]